MSRDMGNVRMISTADAQCGSHELRHSFQLFVTKRRTLSRKFVLSFKSPDRLSLLVAVMPLSHWSALNITKILGVTTATSPEDWGQGIMQANWLCLHVLSTVHRKSGPGIWQCGENVVPHHTWTTCVVVDEEAHVPRVLVNHPQKSNDTLHPLFC
jgi:hypothetical protein